MTPTSAIVPYEDFARIATAHVRRDQRERRRRGAVEPLPGPCPLDQQTIIRIPDLS